MGILINNEGTCFSLIDFEKSGKSAASSELRVMNGNI